MADAGIITENEQQLQANVETDAVDQTNENKDIVKAVNDMLSRSKKYRSRFDKDWRENYNFALGGAQWDIDRPSWRFSEVVNVTWASIMTEIGIQTDSRPKIEFHSQDFSDIPLADILKEIMNRIWERYNYNEQIASGLLDAKVTHVAHAEIVWNEDLENGLGDPDLHFIDPMYCYWDPYAEDVNFGKKKARWFIICEPVPTSVLRERYPEHAAKIKPDIDPYGTDNSDSGIGFYENQEFDQYSIRKLPRRHQMFQKKHTGEKETLLMRAYLRDDTLIQEEYEDVDADGKPTKRFHLKKRYPTGRYVEIANNCLLFDGPPGCKIQGKWVPYLTDQFPIVKLVNYNYGREYIGENEVTHQRGPQKIINYIWSHIMDQFKSINNPVWIVGDGAQVDAESITNEPGMIIETADPNQVRREPGAGVAAGSFQSLDTAMGLFDKVQGLQDVTRGASQPGVTSGVLFEGFVEAAQTRPRLKNRSLDAALQSMGQIFLQQILQFYTLPRVIRLTNKEGFPEAVEFQVTEHNPGDNTKVIKITKIDIDPDTQKITRGEPKNYKIGSDLDIRVSSGSSLPFAKAQRANTAMTFFNAQAIDREELLKAVDWPNREEVIKRLAEKEQEALAAAQAQQQG